jgi:PAS domain-containing protein
MSNVVSDRLAGVIDALKAHICIVDTDGRIVASNEAWRTFAARNGIAAGAGTAHIGLNYLDVCRRAAGADAGEAPIFLDGLSAVLDGERDLFEIEYPCHAPDEQRWFRACVTPLWRSSRSEHETIGAIVSHVNITERKLAEREFERRVAGRLAPALD